MIYNWNNNWKKEKDNNIVINGQKKMGERIDKFFIDKKINNFLDAGCGNGFMISYLSEKYYNIDFDGIDISDFIINNNIIKYNDKINLHFYYYNINNYYPNKKYDIITCIATLHYQKNIINSLKHLYSLLNTNGILIFNYPNIFSYYYYKKYVNENPELKMRYKYILSKTNLLTKKNIQDNFNRKAYSFWKKVNEKTLLFNPALYLIKK